MIAVFLASSRVNAQEQACQDRQVNLVNVFTLLGNNPNTVSPITTLTDPKLIRISQNGVVSGAGLLGPEGVSFTTKPLAEDVPQYGYALVGNSTTPVFVTVFTWRVGPKPNLSSNGFNNFWAEVSASCSQFQSSYLLTALQYKSPKNSNDVASWDVAGKVNTATSGSNCSTPANMPIIEWQSISNTQNNEAYAVAILRGRYQVSSTARAFVRTGSNCCFYKSPNNTTFGIECIPDPACDVPTPTVIGKQCNSSYPVTLKIAEYEDGSEYQNGTVSDPFRGNINETYTIEWISYTGANPGSGTVVGTGWTYNYNGTGNIAARITRTQSYVNYANNTVQVRCASGYSGTPDISNTIISFTPQVTNPNCFGEVATINVSTSGTYSYKLGGSAGSPVTPPFTLGVSGSYTLYAEDLITGCSATQPFTVAIPTDVTLGGTVSNVKCKGGSDGSVTLSAAGGTASYTYSKDGTNFQVSNVFSGFSTGSYTFTVKDSKGCTETFTASITEPLAALSASNTKVDVKCFGASTGSVDASVSGGTAPYTYSWSNGSSVVSTSQDLSNVAAGTYTLTVTDANGCTTTTEAVVDEPDAALSASNTKVDVKCFGESTGSVDASVSGGTAPYTYSWSNGSTSQDLSGLAAGTYTLTVTDANGCTTTTEAVVDEPDAALSASNTKVDVKCFGESNGSVDLTVTGGTSPYTYLWSNGVTSQDLSGLAKGTYSVTVTDANGCTTTSNAIVDEPAKFEPTATGDEVCEDEEIQLSASAGSSYSWSGPGGFTSSLQNPTISDASTSNGGEYTVTVTNASGCTGTATATVVVNTKPNKPTITADKVICLGTKMTVTGSPVGGTWSVVSGGGSFVGNVYTAPNSVSEIAAVISYTVTNAKGCTNDNQETIQFADCSNFCTYSQGYYGNPGGKSCKVIPGSEPGSYTTAQESTIERIRRAFDNYKAANPGATSVKFGVGDRSFNLRESDLNDTYKVKSKLGEMERIFALLPGGGSAMTINARSGGGWNSDNGALSGGPLRLQPNNSVGKINNALLAQTVTMWLNMWASQNELGDWELPATFSTYDAQACGSSIPASGASENKFTTPAPLVGKTVAELLQLANRALAGENIGGGINASMIHGMLGKLVDAFHGCKTFAGTPTLTGARINFGGPVISTAAEVTVKEAPKADVSVKAFPNPYVDQVTFNISVKNAGKGSLVLYNAIGQQVANVFEGNMQANSTQTIRYTVPVSQRKSLVYVFRQNGNTSTGRLVSGK
jgi:hypothetical protein